MFIAFLILQGISLYLLFSFNRFHRIRGLEFAGTFTRFFNSKYNNIEDFFRLREENKRVHAMNDSLMNLLQSNFAVTDTAKAKITEDLPADSTSAKRLYRWTSAQVLYTTVNSDKNYLQINRGKLEGITEDMGVFSSNGGLVGKVINTGDHFSEAMTLLHVLNKLSVQLKRTGNAGILSWDGADPNQLTIAGIPKTDSVRKGDTILTGNYSLSFPAGRMVGVVSSVRKEESTNFLILKVKPTANFASLQQVFIVENLNYTEQKSLNEDTQKRLETKAVK